MRLYLSLPLLGGSPLGPGLLLPYRQGSGRSIVDEVRLVRVEVLVRVELAELWVGIVLVLMFEDFASLPIWSNG